MNVTEIVELRQELETIQRWALIHSFPTTPTDEKELIEICFASPTTFAETLKSFTDLRDFLLVKSPPISPTNAKEIKSVIDDINRVLLTSTRTTKGALK